MQTALEHRLDACAPGISRWQSSSLSSANFMSSSATSTPPTILWVQSPRCKHLVVEDEWVQLRTAAIIRIRRLRPLPVPLRCAPHWDPFDSTFQCAHEATVSVSCKANLRTPSRERL
eukprot:6835855-Prymnesium_polylepis.2